MYSDETERMSEAIISELENELDLSQDYSIDHEALSSFNSVVYLEQDDSVSVLAMVEKDDSRSYDEVSSSEKSYLEDCFPEYDSVDFGLPDEVLFEDRMKDKIGK